MRTLSILNIVEDTVVDGPGFRTSIYAAGCPHRCPGCHNPQSWDIAHGTPYAVEELLQRVLDDPFADVTFSGGDPFYQAEGFTALARAIRSESTKSIWCYTGYLYEFLLEQPLHRALLEQVDVLVDGPFVASLRQEGLRFRGSANQRLIDVGQSLASQQLCLLNDSMPYL